MQEPALDEAYANSIFDFTGVGMVVLPSDRVFPLWAASGEQAPQAGQSVSTTFEAPGWACLWPLVEPGWPGETGCEHCLQQLRSERQTTRLQPFFGDVSSVSCWYALEDSLSTFLSSYFSLSFFSIPNLTCEWKGFRLTPCCSIQQPWASCGYRGLNMWQVQTEMICEGHINTGFCRPSTKKGI